jgi:hypothetical protein
MLLDSINSPFYLVSRSCRQTEIIYHCSFIYIRSASAGQQRRCGLSQYVFRSDVLPYVSATRSCGSENEQPFLLCCRRHRGRHAPYEPIVPLVISHDCALRSCAVSRAQTHASIHISSCLLCARWVHLSNNSVQRRTCKLRPWVFIFRSTNRLYTLDPTERSQRLVGAALMGSTQKRHRKCLAFQHFYYLLRRIDYYRGAAPYAGRHASVCCKPGFYFSLRRSVVLPVSGSNDINAKLC